MPEHRAETHISRGQVSRKNGMLVVAGLITLSLAVATPAFAYWQASGTGTGTGLTGSLAAPTSLVVPATATTTVAVQWTASDGAVVPEGYFVTRSNGTTTSAACGSSASSLTSGTSCTDTPGADGSYSYTVTAVDKSWTAASTASASVRAATAVSLGFDVRPTSTAAGVSLSPALRVALRSAANDAVFSRGVAVTVAISANPASGVLAGTLTRLTDRSGVALFDDLSIDKVGVGYTLTATSPGLAAVTSSAFTVTTAPIAAPNLRSATTYSALGSAVTSAPASSLSGDLGASPTVSATGFPSGSVQGETHTGDAIAAQALADVAVAYADAQSRPADTTFAGPDQRGTSFTPGVHRIGEAFNVSAGGVVTLDAQGDPNAVFIFQVDGALNTAATSSIALVNGATASNVFWASTGAAGTGANSSFSGTILTAGAVTIGAGGTLIGRALAMGAITLASNTIRFTVALPPTITIDGGPAAKQMNRTPTVSGTSSALVGRTITITIGSQALTANVLADHTWAATANALAPGSYSVFVRVRDVDNTAATATQTLSVQ